jgi:hypothetical protein
MKEQILALRAKVGRSSEVQGQATIAVSAPTASLPTIAVHPAATVPLLKLAMSVFSAGILLVLDASSAPVWRGILPVPQPAYPLVYPYPLPPTLIPVLEPRCFRAQSMIELTN